MDDKPELFPEGGDVDPESSYKDEEFVENPSSDRNHAVDGARQMTTSKKPELDEEEDKEGKTLSRTKNNKKMLIPMAPYSDSGNEHIISSDLNDKSDEDSRARLVSYDALRN